MDSPPMNCSWTLFLYCRKYRRWWRYFVRSGEFEKTKSKIKLFGKLSQRYVFTLVR
ncbi:hypothetical protein GQ44DRAFT_717251 [Phaeosphaeriaceae sp. PMI808]|nr:hypothetical protein GQ44DRAFT_717251 [Phaeosphaeriaceae sp. PMI808]